MTEDRMALKALIEKASDTELLAEMLGYVCDRLMQLDVEGLCNAGRYERSEGRSNQRNGCQSVLNRDPRSGVTPWHWIAIKLRIGPSAGRCRRDCGLREAGLFRLGLRVRGDIMQPGRNQRSGAGRRKAPCPRDARTGQSLSRCPRGPGLPFKSAGIEKQGSTLQEGFCHD